MKPSTHVVSITMFGKYRVEATINPRNQIQRIKTTQDLDDAAERVEARPWAVLALCAWLEVQGKSGQPLHALFERSPSGQMGGMRCQRADDRPTSSGFESIGAAVTRAERTSAATATSANWRIRLVP